MYRYGLIFWNEETDDELYGYFEAESFWDAERIISERNYCRPGYSRGALHFIEPRDLPSYKPIESILPPAPTGEQK